MTASTRPLDHYCLVCRYALEHFVEADGHRFEHPKAVQHLAGVHEPVPVPLIELLSVNMLCDICSAPEPAYAYRLACVLMGSQRGVENLGEWWTVCVDCAPALDARSVTRLVDRARVSFRRRGQLPPDNLFGILAPVYRRMLAVPKLTRIGARELLQP